MNTQFFDALIEHPMFFIGNFVVDPLPALIIAYVLVWFWLRRKDKKMISDPFLWHLSCISTVLILSVLFRLAVIFLFSNRNAYELPAEGGTAGFYLLIVPAIISYSYLSNRLKKIDSMSGNNYDSSSSTQQNLKILSMYQKSSISQNNNTENESYLAAMEEYESDKRDKALWARCFALSDGDDAKTKSAYTKERASIIFKLSNNKNISNKNHSEQQVNASDDSAAVEVLNKNNNEKTNIFNLSDKYLLKNKMFKVVKHGDIEIMLLANGRAAVKVKDEIKVFESERICKKADLYSKYPGGLISSIKLDELEDIEILKNREAQKLSYKNFQDMEDKVAKRIPSAMYDMALFLIDGKLLQTDKTKAMYLLESAAINGHSEAKKLWNYLKANN